MNLIFVKDQHTPGKKMARNDRKMAILWVSFISKQSIPICAKIQQTAVFLYMRMGFFWLSNCWWQLIFLLLFLSKWQPYYKYPNSLFLLLLGLNKHSRTKVQYFYSFKPCMIPLTRFLKCFVLITLCCKTNIWEASYEPFYKALKFE